MHGCDGGGHPPPQAKPRRTGGINRTQRLIHCRRSAVRTGGIVGGQGVDQIDVGVDDVSEGDPRR